MKDPFKKQKKAKPVTWQDHVYKKLKELEDRIKQLEK